MEKEFSGSLLYWETCGDLQNGTPVLFLHGWGCDHTFFASFRTDSPFPSVAVDFPGHGRSAEPVLPFRVADFADQVLALLDELALRKVHIVAHSFGGRVALYLAANHPERVGKMLITGGAGLRKEATRKQKRKLRRYQTAQRMLGRVKKARLLNAPVEKLQKRLQKKHASPDYLALSDGMKETFKLVVNEDLSALLPLVQAPTLLIWGTADTETPLWMGQRMEKEIPDAALVTFDGKTHFAFLEDRQRFRVIMEAFFREEVQTE